ncbi:MAG: hypothetical protein ACREFD_12745 [Stellaceae bacterium]
MIRVTAADRLRLVGFGVLAAAPAFVGYGDFILNHFYRYGAVLLDSGLLADLAWHQGPSLAGSFLLDGKGFYAFHIAPIFVLLSALSRLAPVAMAQWFAIFTGTAQALLAVAVFWLLAADYGLRRGWRIAAAILLAVAFSYNGLAIAQVRYPHFEILIAAGMMLFVVAWRHRQWVLAAAFFLLTLLCREDAGFQLVAVLGVVIALQWRDGVPLSRQRPALIFLGLGLAYSVGAVVLSTLLFPDHSSFIRTYLGSPPFGHLSWALVGARAAGYLTARGYIFLPAILATIWAIAARNPYIVAGYIAFIPWTLLHLVAASPLAGTLSSYYGFPYLVAAFWPLIGYRMRPARRRYEPFLGFAVMILASFAGLSAQHDPTHIPLLAGFTDPPAFAEQARVEQAMTAIAADHAALGRVLAGDSVASLKPEAFHRDETWWDGPPGRRDSLLYFAHDRDAARMARLAKASGLARRYAVAGTPIRLWTDRRPAQLPRLGRLLKPAT